MKIAAIVLFVLAALATLVAINNVFLREGGIQPEGAENFVGYAVGSFLLPMILLVGGLFLLNRAKGKRGSKGVN